MNQKQDIIARLFRQHYTKLLRLANGMLHDEDESRDAVSDVFVSMMQGHACLDDKAEGYLAVSVRNRCRDMIAHKQIRQRVERLIPVDNTVWLSDDAEQQRYVRLRHLVDTLLTEQTRQVFLMRFDRHMKYAEIAAALDVSEKTVYKHLHQAITKLQEQFKDQKQ